METTERNDLWQNILESVKVAVSPAIFSTWFSQTHLTRVQKKGKRYIAEIGCASAFIKTTLENRYFGVIQDALSKSLGSDCDLLFVVKQAPVKKGAEPVTPLFTESASHDVAQMLKSSNIRKGFTFDNFAVSSSNQMAWAAAEAVSNNPGDAYNPLFVWGGVGVGKSHLMSAVGYSILRTTDDAKIIYCSGEEFTNDIVEGIRNKTTQAFRNKYRKIDVLLIDDIQFIAGKDAVQEEFFHTFNTVTAAGGQVILTSDKPPSDISLLEERLRSRFEAGLIVDISPPDFELRCAIIQIKSTQKEIDLDMELVQMIAGNVSSARRIEGFITRIASESTLKKIPINKDLVQSIIGKAEEAEDLIKKTSPSALISTVCEYFSLGKRAMLGPTRTRQVAFPRQILMYLLRTQLGLPLQEVGRLIGGRDHTTVMHAVDKITTLASSDKQLRGDLLGIKNML